MSEFLNRKSEEELASEETFEETSEELDVQKAVVESLAADKAEQEEKLTHLQKENESLKCQVTSLNEKIAALKAEFEKVGDILARNSEEPVSNVISLLDRNVDVDDRFTGETRDHVLEVIGEARERAEKEGLRRRAQVLEGVLAVNEPTGNLKSKRAELKRIFEENGNIINGTVIGELEKRGISHKNGDEYLLADEIIKRTY